MVETLKIVPSSFSRVVRRQVLKSLYFLCILVLFAWLVKSIIGSSRILVQIVGIGVFASLFLPLVLSLLKRPNEIVRPIFVFFTACIYFFALDMALLRGVDDFSAEIIFYVQTIIIVFLVCTISMWLLVQVRSTPWQPVLKKIDVSFNAKIYFWLAVFVFSLEYLRRLYFADWSFPTLLSDSLLARAGGGFRRGVAGDWRVVFTPIEVFFWFVVFFADRAWKAGISKSRKIILFIIILLQLGTLIIDGNRGYLLFAILLPLFTRASQFDSKVRRWLLGLVAASFLLAPVMDAMQMVRGLGWSKLYDVQGVSWNIVRAERENNFHYTVRLVNFLEEKNGVLKHKGPLGFVDGVESVTWHWLINPIPRFLWPDKPLVTEMADETREWMAATSVIAELLRLGGMSFVIVGALFFGIWISFLDPIFAMIKADGSAFAYSLLLVTTTAMVRTLMPWTVQVLLLIFFMVAFFWYAMKTLLVHRDKRVSWVLSESR